MCLGNEIHDSPYFLIRSFNVKLFHTRALEKGKFSVKFVRIRNAHTAVYARKDLLKRGGGLWEASRCTRRTWASNSDTPTCLLCFLDFFFLHIFTYKHILFIYLHFKFSNIFLITQKLVSFFFVIKWYITEIYIYIIITMKLSLFEFVVPMFLNLT